MDNSGAFERDLGGASMAEESKATDWTDDQLEPSWVVDTEEIRRPNSGKVTLASDAHSDLTEKVRHSKHRDKRRSEGTSTSPRTSRSSTREQRRSSHSSPTASPRTSNGSSPGRKERHERSRESSRRSEKDRRESRSRQSHLVRPGGVRLAGPAEIERPRRPSRLSTQSNTSNSSSNSSRASRAPVRYSVTELVQTLGNEKSTHEMDPELQRRVLDFRLAQQKRREKYGEHGKTGIFGMYAHLSDVRCDLEWSEDAAWRRKHGHPYLSWTDFDAVRQKTAHRSWFTYFIIFICSIMLIVEFGLNDWKVAPLIVNPLVGPSPQALIEAGARVTPLIVEDGQWFRIFSPLFLHAGIIHFFLNMAALWFIGAAVEQSHGIANAMILFFVPGIGGNILSAIFLPQYISVGASGGIFGLVGGCVADIALNWNLLFIKSGEEDNKTKRRNIVAIVWIAADMLINIIVGFTPYVDVRMHVWIGMPRGTVELTVEFLAEFRPSWWIHLWRLLRLDCYRAACRRLFWRPQYTMGKDSHGLCALLRSDLQRHPDHCHNGFAGDYGPDCSSLQ